MKTNKKTLFWVTLLLVTLATSCNLDKIYERAQDIDQAKWNKTHPVRFDISIKDTIQGYDIFINVRNNNNYSYKNVFLFVNTTSPKGYSKRDTVELTLADDKGKWLGNGIGGINNIEKKYKMNVRFPSSGTYKFEIMQGMRNDILEGITDVGLRIEKVN